MLVQFEVTTYNNSFFRARNVNLYTLSFWIDTIILAMLTPNGELSVH